MKTRKIGSLDVSVSGLGCNNFGRVTDASKTAEVVSASLDAGVNFVEAIPSDLAWARAVPAVAGLRPGFKSPNAVILPGASRDPDFDIAQLQGLQKVREHAFSLRLDYKINNRWSMYGRGFHDNGKNDQPEGVTGRSVHITDNPTNAVFNLQGLLSDRTTNEFKFGYNAAPTQSLSLIASLQTTSPNWSTARRSTQP